MTPFDHIRVDFWITRELKFFCGQLGSFFFFFETFLMEFICTWRYVYELNMQETLHRERGGQFYSQRWTYDPWLWCTDSIKPFTRLEKKRGMENLVLNIFCSMTSFKKLINYGDISNKLILGTFTSSSSFSNSSNFKR